MSEEAKIEPLKSEIFFYTDYGTLGRVMIVLPVNNGGDEQFEQDFDDTLSFVATIMTRRVKARRQAPLPHHSPGAEDVSKELEWRKVLAAALRARAALTLNKENDDGNA